MTCWGRLASLTVLEVTTEKPFPTIKRQRKHSGKRWVRQPKIKSEEATIQGKPIEKLKKKREIVVRKPWGSSWRIERRKMNERSRWEICSRTHGMYLIVTDFTAEMGTRHRPASNGELIAGYGDRWKGGVHVGLSPGDCESSSASQVDECVEDAMYRAAITMAMEATTDGKVHETPYNCREVDSASVTQMGKNIVNHDMILVVENICCTSRPLPPKSSMRLPRSFGPLFMVRGYQCQRYHHADQTEQHACGFEAKLNAVRIGELKCKCKKQFGFANRNRSSIGTHFDQKKYSIPLTLTHIAPGGRFWSGDRGLAAAKGFALQSYNCSSGFPLPGQCSATRDSEGYAEPLPALNELLRECRTVRDHSVSSLTSSSYRGLLRCRMQSNMGNLSKTILPSSEPLPPSSHTGRSCCWHATLL
ncbi:hypothetical protein HYFRA_00011693 [Hymenoscyphus fraxineus]|uniref:Uncharacterized protein n=1 Tax=Hymenoscyphus fraxineus TaxID=746836 RepID=A0A9N9KYH6_9HELO|nr:hypothetical protein HYFRA_00011693 [Hymenoscyphus fraxineus]